MHKLRELGRCRLWVRLPKFRGALEADVHPTELNDLFEAYALAAGRLEELRETEQPDQLLVFEYEVASRGIQEEVARLLDAIHVHPVHYPLSSHVNGQVPAHMRIRTNWQSSH